MERWVQLVVAGGVALVAGLWVLVLVKWGSPPWALGLVLVAAGAVGLLGGIGSEIEVRSESSAGQRRP